MTTFIFFHSAGIECSFRKSSIQISMSSQTARSRAVRGSRRLRRGFDLDLNIAPPSEIPEAQGNLGQHTSLEGFDQHGQPQMTAPIDVDAIDDDDVVLSSPRAFAEVCALAYILSFLFQFASWSCKYLYFSVFRLETRPVGIVQGLPLLTLTQVLS